MMKNIYSLGPNAYQVERDRFRLDISYRSDSTGTWLDYLPGITTRLGDGGGSDGRGGVGSVSRDNVGGGSGGGDGSGGNASEPLLRVMNLDRLNDRGDPYPDGMFDFLEGLTIDSDNGYIHLPGYRAVRVAPTLPPG